MPTLFIYPTAQATMTRRAPLYERVEPAHGPTRWTMPPARRPMYYVMAMNAKTRTWAVVDLALSTDLTNAMGRYDHAVARYLTPGAAVALVDWNGVEIMYQSKAAAVPRAVLVRETPAFQHPLFTEDASSHTKEP